MHPTRIHPDFARYTTSSQPSSSAEAWGFFQSRLALFGQIGFFFTLAFLVLSNSLLLLAGNQTLRDVSSDPSNLPTLANIAIAGGLWLGCGRGRRSPAALRVLDPLASILYCAFTAAVPWLSRADATVSLTSLLPVTFVVIGRAVLVPSSAARTAWISTLCYLPLFGVTYWSWSRPGLPWIEGQCPPSTAVFILRGLVGAAMATVISHVIYGLRRQVHQARQLGQYRLEEKLGAGSMGEVYRGRHAMLRRPTAVKLLSPDRAGEKNIARFEREVQLTSLLTHPNTIAIFDYGRTPDGIFYYAMEYLEGMTLEQLVHTHGPQPPGRVIHLLSQVCYSLAEAHSFGLIHRDIKPANLILCNRGGIHDFVKVVDFGLVRHMDTGDDATISAVNTIAGTPLYMPPESIRNPQSVDHRGDLYALGAVGYYLLTGRPLFEGYGFMEVCSLQLTKTPERASAKLGKPLPEDLEDIVSLCLEKEPDRRPRSAKDLRAALLACDDAGRWDEDAASAWWREHGPPARASTDPDSLSSTQVAAEGEDVTSLPTVEIDLENRLAR